MVRVVTTGPIVLDEGGRAGQGFIEISGDVAQVLKSYVAPGQLYAWQTATGQRFPAASGIVITANELRVIDPATGGEKIARVEFSRPIGRKNIDAFNKWLLANEANLAHFGSYYLKYAEANWQSVRDIILNPDWVKAAVDYFNIVLASLGVPAQRLLTARETSSYRERLREILDMYVSRYVSVCRSTSSISYDECIRMLAEGFYIPWLRYDGNTDVFIILPNFKEYSGIPVKAICMEIPGAAYDTKATRNVKYYGKCAVPKDSLLKYLELA